jgi:CTP:molybdopterin cytidylyltransferase MocA
VLVLAGRRGPKDALAVSVGATHRALVPIAGIAMVERVTETLRRVGVEHVSISIDQPEAIHALPRMRALAGERWLDVRVSSSSPASSVLDFLGSSDGAPPCLVTTADHPLLTAPMVERFWTEALSSGADIAVGVVSERVFRARYPEARRTFVRFADEAVSGANLFAFLTPAAIAVADFWRGQERHRKKPWRLIGAFGLQPLLRFATGRLRTDEALELVERVTQARAALIRLPFAEAAIDVDRASDLEIVSELLAAKDQSGTHP